MSTTPVFDHCGFESSLNLSPSGYRAETCGAQDRWQLTHALDTRAWICDIMNASLAAEQEGRQVPPESDMELDFQVDPDQPEEQQAAAFIQVLEGGVQSLVNEETEDMVEAVVSLVRNAGQEVQRPCANKVCVLGESGIGKSQLINSIAYVTDVSDEQVSGPEFLGHALACPMLALLN
jgi:hypothetical protein